MIYQECLNALTEEQQKLFEKNIKEDRDYNEEILNLIKCKQFDNVFEFLATAFVWGQTAEGHDFWSDIAHKHINQEKRKNYLFSSLFLLYSSLATLAK